MGMIKERWQAGETAVGVMASELYSPNLPRIFRVCGFDYMIIDCEHGYYDYAAVAAMAAVAHAERIDLLVRVPGVAREWIIKYLEMGVDGLIFPMISIADEIKQAIEWAKYPPKGKRGVSTTRPHSDYGVKDLNGYMASANEKTMVFAQIETAEALSNLSEIAQAEGLDGIIMGPNDLSVDLGISGDDDHPLMVKAREDIAGAALTAKKSAGVITSNMKLLSACESKGMKLLCWNSELGLIIQGARQGLAAIRQKQGQLQP